MLTCDICGRRLPESCFVETIEEYLCEDCASGLQPDDDLADCPASEDDSWFESRS